MFELAIAYCLFAIAWLLLLPVAIAGRCSQLLLPIAIAQRFIVLSLLGHVRITLRSIRDRTGNGSLDPPRADPPV